MTASSASASFSGAAMVGGVVGAPVRHSLSPLIHSAWIAASGADAVYIPLELAPTRFEAFIEAVRGGSIRGLNVTLPFKERALAMADRADPAAKRAGAANLLLFHPDGGVEARNTDGLGLLGAFTQQAPRFDVAVAPVAILGAGGAARGAAAALLAAGAPQVRILNRTLARAERIAELLGRGARAYALEQAEAGFADVGAVVNATSAGLDGVGSLQLPWSAIPERAVLMDMVYRPLETAFLREARERERPVVDGLAMLICQAIPSFQAIFGLVPPGEVDVRALVLDALGEAP